MIKVHKSHPAPQFLTRQGTPTSAADMSKYNYKDDSVREQLRKDQHNKCCYCERLLDEIEDIEHFRPKKRYKDVSGVTHTPGYYWLLTDWENLMYCCAECNRTCKNDHFGLIDENARMKHHTSANKEQPLFIDPVHENPAEYIAFRRYCAIPTGDEETKCRGSYTISRLKLNRRLLLLKRKERWEQYNSKKTTLKILEKVPYNAEVGREMLRLKRELDLMTYEWREFSGMFRNQV